MFEVYQLLYIWYFFALLCNYVQGVHEVRVGVVMVKGDSDPQTEQLDFRYELIAPALDMAGNVSEEMYGKSLHGAVKHRKFLKLFFICIYL